MATDWAARYLRLLADILDRPVKARGYPPGAIRAAEARLGVRLPEPLRAYYLSVGKHRINQAHNRLLPPADLFVARQHLVFLEENQACLYWGLRTRSAAADPVASRTMDVDDGSWVTEAACSRLLATMLCQQAVMGGLPHVGCTDPVDRGAARRLTRGWPAVGRVSKMSAFVRPGQVLCVLEADATTVVYVGTRRTRDLHALTAGAGFAVHEL